MKKLYLNWRNYWGILLVLGGVVLVLAMLATSPTGTRAQERLGYEKTTPDFVPAGRTDEGRGHQVIERDSVAYGRTYAEWMAAWDQWSYSLPVDTHPLFTDGDCSVGQSGPVWFLGGAFVAPWTRVRHCNIPADTALFFPVWDWEDSALEETVEHPGDEAYQQIAGMRSFVFQLLNQYVSPTMFCEIDGKPIPNFLRDFRIQSTVFGFTIPDNNLLNQIYSPNTFPAGTYFPAVDDGWDVLLAPLPPGDHTLVFPGITYYLHVAKESGPALLPAAPGRLWKLK